MNVLEKKQLNASVHAGHPQNNCWEFTVVWHQAAAWAAAAPGQGQQYVSTLSSLQPLLCLEVPPGPGTPPTTPPFFRGNICWTLHGLKIPFPGLQTTLAPLMLALNMT